MPGTYRKHSYTTAGRLLEVVDCSITDLERVDALVSSDDNYLSHGGGVSRVLWSAAGPELRHWADENVGRLRLGDVVRTPAFGLRANHLLHAVTIDFDENRRIGPADAHALYGAVFDLACRHGCATLGMPLLGTGAGRLSASSASVALAQAWHERALHDIPLRQVFVCALAEDFETVNAVLDARLPNEPPFAALVEAAAARIGGAGAQVLRDSWRKMTGAPPGQEHDGYLLLFYEACVVASQKAGGADAPESTRRARHARNQLAHGTPAEADRIELRHVLLQACEYLLGHVCGERPKADEGSPMLLPLVLQEVVAPFEPAPPTHARAEPTAPGAGGTRHVRQLADFLLDALGEERLAELLAQLEAEGYQGEPELRVLEFCVNLPDPVEYLASEFSRGELRRHLLRCAGIQLPADSDARACAQALLDFFGFPVRRAFYGLGSALRATLHNQRAAHAAQSVQEITGAVTEAAKQLEFVTLVLLRFVCQAAFHTPAETFLRSRGLLEDGYQLDRCSLGKLLELLERLGKILQDDASAYLAIFRRNYETRALAPEEAGRIAALRNQHAHWLREGPLDLMRARVRAVEFFRAALAYLDHLRAPASRIFPTVLAIEAIEIDRWGRRKIIARDENGDVERLFTDSHVRPGELYYMHPLTNPLRVDPILVPAGDQVAPQSQEAARRGRMSSSRER